MKVKELLSSPERWTKGAERRDADGEPTLLEGEHVASRCLYGALYCAYRATPERFEAELKIKVEFIGMGVNKTLYEWNDAPERTFEDVRQLVTELDI